ncbi:hypothetical protein U9M48_044323 [Paspalum notatum var. saurae]|uniref:WRKY domain-containing protein n=1 Tax=Paspalum notatum var. saurae TaxID=547442 RepID=A0AAQ3XHD6_PASNO
MATAAMRTSAACEVMAEAREASVRLLALLQATGADPGRQELARQIICCIDRALTAARAGGGKRRSPDQGFAARPPAGSRRRPRGVEEARARMVMRPTMEDGFAWRKYGEKSIHRQSSPRLYFRCAYKDDHRCGARKQVERVDDDPSLFRTTYFGDHTPACPRDTARVAEADGGGHFVLRPASFCSFGPCLQAEAGNERPLRPAEMVEFIAEDCWDEMADLASFGGVSLSSPGPGGLESFGAANLEELLKYSVDEFFKLEE